MLSLEMRRRTCGSCVASRGLAGWGRFETLSHRPIGYLTIARVEMRREGPDSTVPKSVEMNSTEDPSGLM